MNEDDTRGACKYCGGPIYRPEIVPGGRTPRAWLHADAADWTATPHDAVPAGPEEA